MGNKISGKSRSAREWFKQYSRAKEELWNGHLGSPSFFKSTLDDRSKDAVEKIYTKQLTEYNEGCPRK